MSDDLVKVARIVLRKAINLHRVVEYAKEHSQAAICMHRPTEVFDDELRDRALPGWKLVETAHIGGKRIRTYQAPEAVDGDGRRTETRGGQDANGRS